MCVRHEAFDYKLSLVGALVSTWQAATQEGAGTSSFPLLVPAGTDLFPCGFRWLPEGRWESGKSVMFDVSEPGGCLTLSAIVPQMA